MALSIAPLHGAGLAQQDAAERALVLAGREHEQLAGDVLVVALLGELVGEVQQLAEVVGDHAPRRRCPRPAAAGPAPRRAGAQQVDVGVGLARAAGAPCRPPGRAARHARAAGSMNWWSRPTASVWASASAIWNLLVSLSIRMGWAPGCVARLQNGARQAQIQPLTAVRSRADVEFRLSPLAQPERLLGGLSPGTPCAPARSASPAGRTEPSRR